MQIPEKKILDKYGLNINNISPFRQGYLISAIDDRYLLRRADFSANRLLYIYKAKKHLENMGFSNTDKFINTLDGEPYVFFNDALYYMTTIPKGRECNLLLHNDIMLSAKSLAEFHNAADGFEGGNGPETHSELYKIPTSFLKRLEELKKNKKIAKKSNKEFDGLYLKYADFFIELGEKAIDLLVKSRYEDLCKKAEEDGTFCHHDFTHSNILIDNESEVNIINFEFICPELGIYDLTNFLRRKLRKCSWNFNEGQFIIEQYMSVKELSIEEFRVMGIMLMFPQKMWRVCNRYYNSKRSFFEKGFIVQMKEVIEEIEPIQKFIEKYEKEYCDYK